MEAGVDLDARNLFGQTVSWTIGAEAMRMMKMAKLAKFGAMVSLPCFSMFEGDGDDSTLIFACLEWFF